MFRREVLDQKRDRLTGDVFIAVPLGWHVVGGLLLLIVAVSGLFLSVAGYSRVETVTGAIMPDSGLSSILPSRPGVLTQVLVEEGEYVAAGAPLAEVRTEEQSWQEQSATLRVEEAIERQDKSLETQIANIDASAQAQKLQLEAQRDSIAAGLEDVEAQIAVQEEILALARESLSLTETGEAQGVITGRDLQQRREAMMGQEQALLQLNQTLAAQRSEAAQTDRMLVQLDADTAAQIASLESVRSDLARQAVMASADRSYVLRAPLDGRVTALTIRPGQAVSAETPLMSIVPDGSVLQAELNVPSTAIGFIEEGQSVRLAVDAFPYDRFGTVSGTVIRVASSAIFLSVEEGQRAPVYPVTVALDSQHLTAFGRDQSFVPGMTLTARILTEKRNLFEMLFEPVFAVARR